MTQILQPGQHPDADQLNAFVEHSLTQHEQQETLAHLATCSDCRAIVYLSQSTDLDASMPPQPFAGRKPSLFGWSLFSGWKLAWPAAAALACLVFVTIHFRNAGKADYKAAPDKTAQLEQAPPRLTVTPPPAQVVPPKSATAPIQKPQPIIALSAHRRSAETTTNAVALHGNAHPQGLGGFVAGRSYAVSNGYVRAESATAGDQQSLAGTASGTVFQSAKASPATAATDNVFNANAAQQSGGGAGNADGPQPGSASAAVVPMRSSPAPTTLHSLSSQYNAPPPPAPPPPTAPSSAAPGNVNQTVTVSDAAVSVEPESATSAEVITGAAFGSLQSNKSMMMKKQLALPSHRPALSVISNTREELAIDTAGALFRSDDTGVTWQPVAVQWTGRAVRIALDPSPNQRQLARDASPAATPSTARSSPAGSAQPAVFELTNDAGDLWISKDGRVWKHK
jgi:hypothetical protein